MKVQRLRKSQEIYGQILGLIGSIRVLRSIKQGSIILHEFSQPRSTILCKRVENTRHLFPQLFRDIKKSTENVYKKKIKSLIKEFRKL